ncbi:hypothetical protein FG152_17740 [Ochrobactrum sp. XJ1]|nr:hypothetical protein [Ochrobactrum sp. XJ1]
MAAIYDGLVFKTTLEARWAAFFDLAKWDWDVNPVPVGDWVPDFRVSIPCGHSECSGSHDLLVSILPVANIDDAGNHPALLQRYEIEGPGSEHHKGIDAGAVFGINPHVSRFEFAHGAGSGVDDVPMWVENANALWEQAGKRVS